MRHHHVLLAVAAAGGLQALAAWTAVRHGPRAVEAFAGAGAALAALATFVASEVTPRQQMATLLLLVWSVRLTVYLYRRNMPPKVALQSLALSRAVWSVGAALPCVMLNASETAPGNINALELLFAASAAFAIAVEAAADRHKELWHQCGAARRERFLSSGLWADSRHPNLWGEMTFHWAEWALCVRGTPVWGVVAPLAMAWYITRGPLASLECCKALAFKDDPKYAEYVARTSPLTPMPPSAYERVPMWARLWLLGEREDWADNKMMNADVIVAAIMMSESGRPHEEDGTGGTV